jgi:hypothetical protein|nr:MAG TPA: hypothetical protein [Caudoviricetes sp.]
MWYKIDIYKLGQHLLPSTLRQKKMFAFLSVLILPFAYLISVFLQFRGQSLNKLNTNGQVIYIEKVLNDRFFMENREIYITDVNTNDFLYMRSETNTSIYLYMRREVANKRFLKQRGEEDYGNENTGNFIVNVPSLLSEYESEIRNLVEFYKPAGRSYVLNIYDYE